MRKLGEKLSTFLSFLFVMFLGCATDVGKPVQRFRIVDVFPPAGFQISATQLSISVVFSKAVDKTSLSDESIKVIKDGVEIGKVITTPDDQKIKITPQIISKGKYRVLITRNIKSIAGESLEEDFSWEFYAVGEEEFSIPITPSPISALVKSIYPPHMSVVGTDTIVYVVFTKRMINVSSANFLLYRSDGSLVESSVTYIGDGNIAVLRPKELLLPGEVYVATLRATVRAHDGESLGRDFFWTFRTAGVGKDTTPPYVTFANPPDGAVDVPRTAEILILFSEDIDILSITPTNLQLAEENTGTISYEFEYVPSLFLLKIKPSLLQRGKRYILRLRGIRDKAGNVMVGEFVSSFRVMDEEGLPPSGPGFPPEIMKIFFDDEPVDLPQMPVGVSTIPTIKIFFSDRIEPSTVNQTTLFITDGLEIVPSSISFSTSLTSVFVVPTVELRTRRTYWLFVAGGIRDKDGESLANPVTFPFRTLGIFISSPAPGEFLKGIVNVDVEFSGKVKRLELWVDSTRRQVALAPITSPFTFVEDTRLHPDGQKNIRVLAYLRTSVMTYSVSVTFDNSPPSVVVQHPSERAVLSGLVSFSVMAGDLQRLGKVSLFIDDVFVDNLTVPTVPPNTYVFSINTSFLSDGEHTIKFVAEDRSGNRAEAKRLVIVDNSPPAGLFVSPLAGSTVSKTIRIEANVSDNVGVKKVEFFVNSARICDAVTVLCEITSPPWRMLWDSTALSYFPSASITGVVEDMGGLRTVFATSVTVDNTAPMVSVSSPPSGMYIKGLTTISVSFSDLSSVTSVSVFVNDVLKFSSSNPSSPYVVMWDTSMESDGTKVLRAVAYDKAGNAGSSHITVIVDNTPPSVSIISPVSGSFTNALSTTLEASATDAILLDRVEFYVNGSFAGIDSSPPTYAVLYDISFLPDGIQGVTAVACDFAGNCSTTPSEVTFVIDRTPPVVDFVDPLTGSVVEGTKSVKVVASDVGFVRTISIRAGSTVLGSCTLDSISGTCAKNWSTSGDANDVVLTVTASDRAGNQGVTQIAVMVDNLFPSVSVTSPKMYYLRCPTDTVLGTRASDANSITSVVMEFLELPAENLLASFHFYYSGITEVSEFSTLSSSQCGPDGRKRFRVRVFDRGGKMGVATYDVFVDNTPPTVLVIYPPSSPSPECVGGVTVVRVQICDDVFLHNMSVFVDSGLISSSNISSSVPCSSPQMKNISWDSRSFSDGGHTVSVHLRDAAGNIRIQDFPIIIDNSRPAISVLSPSDGSTVMGSVFVNTVLGDSVCAPPTYGFRKVEYQIALSGTASFSSSTRECGLAQRIPCTDTNVGAGSSSFLWSATEYCGFYNLKARAFDYVGNVSERTITLKIQPPGCPIEESWGNVSVVGSIRTTPVVRDLDSPPDGKKEIIFGTDAGRVYGVSESIIVQNASMVGSPIRSIFLEVFVGGLPRVVFGMLDTARRVRALNLFAPFLSDFSSLLTQTGIYSSASTIFADGNTTVFLIGDLAGRVWIHGIGLAGLTVAGCIPSGVPLECGLNSPAISDINGDTQPDITTTPLPVDMNCDGVYDTVVVTASDGHITAISLATGSKIWTIYTGSAVLSSPVLADFGSDCSFEILVGTGGGALYCVPETGAGNCPGWTSQFYSAGGAVYSLAVTDVDSCLSIGDGHEDIVFGAGVNLVLLSRWGTLKSQRNLMSIVVSTPAVADIDGDGCGEIFVATQNGNVHGFYLRNVGGSVYPEYLTGFPKSTGGNISLGVSPIVCDVDLDPNLELVIGNDSSTLKVYDLGSGGRVKWVPGATFCHLGAFGCQRRWDSLSACGY